MYCSACGAAVAQGLSYCNLCGAKLRDQKADYAVKSTEVKPESLIAAIATVFVLGMVAIMFLLMAMKMVGLNAGQILAFTLLSFLIMLLLEGVFIRLLFRSRRGADESRDTELPKQQAAKELDAALASGGLAERDRAHDARI